MHSRKISPIAAFAGAAVPVALVCVVIYFAFFVGLDRLDWPVVASEKYFVSTSGRDARVYEWESQLDPGTTCVAMFAESGGPVGLHCLPGEE